VVLGLKETRTKKKLGSHPYYHFPHHVGWVQIPKEAGVVDKVPPRHRLRVAAKLVQESLLID
jgi:hypothetical protein